MCKIDHNSHWYWDCTNHQKLVLFSDIEWMTLREAICKMFNTSSWDIKNSPWLYWICCDPIIDFNKIIDESFLFLHITKKPKRMEFTDFHRKWWLTEETYNLCSDYRLIVPFDWKDNKSITIHSMKDNERKIVSLVLGIAHIIPVWIWLWIDSMPMFVLWCIWMWVFAYINTKI